MFDSSYVLSCQYIGISIKKYKNWKLKDKLQKKKKKNNVIVDRTLRYLHGTYPICNSYFF